MKSPTFLLTGELIAEAVAMIIIISFGDSVAAMYTLRPQSLPTRLLGRLHCLGPGRDDRHLHHRLRKRMPR